MDMIRKEMTMAGKRSIDLRNKTILVTGSPGFIGANLVKRLLNDDEAEKVISVDNLNDYYDVGLKIHRLDEINCLMSDSDTAHIFKKGDLKDASFVNDIFKTFKPDIVVNLAAQAGVRYSIEYPEKYIDSNIIGFFNILEACRHSYDGGMKGL